MKKVVVLGAGISGLATAALLAKAGHEVTVLERNSWVGGKSRRIELQGQRLDTGPALVTFPEVWQEFLSRYNAFGGVQAKEIVELEFVKLNEVGRYFYGDEVTDLPVKEDHKWFSQWERFKTQHQTLTSAISKLLTAHPLDTKALPALLKMSKVYGFRLSTSSYINSLKWMSDGLKEVIKIHTLNAGISPKKTLPLYASMTAAMATEGISVPVGGVNEIPQALYKLALAAGVKFHFDTPVVGVKKHQVATADKVFDCDYVVSSLDPQVLKSLMKPSYVKKSKPRACSGVAIYAVLKEELPPESVTHSVIMPDSVEELYKSLENFTPPKQTMAFVNYYRPQDIYPNSKPTVAVLLTAPADGKTYDLESPWVKSEIQRISNLLGLRAPISELFVEHQILTPEYFGSWGGYGGALYGDTRKLWQSGPFHTPAYNNPLRPWLWRVGASVHPGGGIPAVLGGSLIATQQLLKVLGTSPDADSMVLVVSA